MTIGTAPPPPSAFPPDLNPYSALYGFATKQWVDPPKPTGPEWFSSEERCRRAAHANAYQQHGIKVDWHRYTLLGYFTFEDCSECDKVWANIHTNPLLVHRSIWYTFMYHIDQDIPIPEILNTWATSVTQPYLAHFDPTTLHSTNTLECEWRDMPFMLKVSSDNANNNSWIPVQGRRRSKSPPTSEMATNTLSTNESTESSTAPGFNLPKDDISPIDPKSIRPPSSVTPNNYFWPKPPTVSTVIEETMEDIQIESIPEVQMMSPEVSVSPSRQTFAPQMKLPPHPVIPTNDGTHWLNIRWTPPLDIQEYEHDNQKTNTAIHSLVLSMFPPGSGKLYRWASVDDVDSKPIQTLTATELREFVTPTVTVGTSTSQLIFGIRFGFTQNPVRWKKQEHMADLFKTRKLEIQFSNSQSNSGRMVNAGFVLFKAPKTTHLYRYTQYLRSLVPDNTPFFDVQRYKKTPMDKNVLHLVVQCGEQHVIPLCHALTPILTGKGKALFLPRYALSTMSDEQVNKYFQVHDDWSKSLTALQLTPRITHLDQARREYYTDGTMVQRSTREWAGTIRSPDGLTPALCDVTNGSKEQQTYLVFPKQYLDHVQQQWREYKTRLDPPTRREARFRERLPGLPTEIVIQTEIQENVSFLDQLSAAAVWHQAPASVREPSETAEPTTKEFPPLPTYASAPSPGPVRNAWEQQHRQNKSIIPPPHALVRPKRPKTSDIMETSGDPTSVDQEEDRSTASTHSLTQMSTSATQHRFHELEQLLQSQQRAMDVASQKAADRLLSLENQFRRLDEMDLKLTAVQKSMDANTHQVTQTAAAQQQMSHKIESMNTDSVKQFATMNEKVLLTMESQQKMSTNMLAMRTQFDQLSAVMMAITSKLQTVTDPPKCESTSAVDGNQERNYTKRSKQQPTDSSQNSVSSQSQTSLASSNDSSIYKSPEKKKRRPQEPQCKDLATVESCVDQEMGEAAESVGNAELEWDMALERTQSVDGFHDSTDPNDRVNLEEAFNRTLSPSSSDIQCISDTPEEREISVTTKVSSPRKVPGKYSSLQKSLASLDPQYNINKDPAEADSS